MSPLDHSRLRAEVVRIARANVGYKETEGNNAGQFIRALGGIDGQDWCALFAAHCYRRAYDNLFGLLPDFCFKATGKPHTGAKALTKALGNIGRIWKPGRIKPLPGDLVCWNRTKIPGDWRGHVGVVVDSTGAVSFKYIAGNEGRDGEVKVRTAYYDGPKLWRFASVAR